MNILEDDIMMLLLVLLIFYLSILLMCSILYFVEFNKKNENEYQIIYFYTKSDFSLTENNYDFDISKFNQYKIK